MKEKVNKTAPREISKKNERVFKIIAILLPVLLFILLELFLRAIGYGYDLSLFKDYEKSDKFYVLNDKIGLKYFSNKQDARAGGNDIFLKKKTDNTFRIFVIGASSGIGFPYEKTTTFDKSVKYQLMHLFPDINFEVVNLSITAVNSYSFLDIAKESIAFDPDMIFVYGGHNEYYGALGVGSSSKIGNNRKYINFILKLRKLKTTQLFRSFKMKRKFNKKDLKARENKSLMERMAAMQSIPYNSKAYFQGIKQYKENMEELYRVLSKQNIPVLYCTIISNEKDVKPFISDKDTKEKSATYQYQLANKAYNDSNYLLAKEKYVLAKELDMLRFRAPVKINETVKELCDKYENVYLVNAEEKVISHTSHGILDDEVLLEHVHPTLYGHHLISNAFIETLKENQLISSNWPSNEVIDKVQSQVPFTKVDSIRGKFIATTMIKVGWPFYEQIPADFKFGNSFEEKLAEEYSNLQISWAEMIDRLIKYYFQNKNYNELKAVFETAATILSYDPSMNSNAGRANEELGDFEKALFYYKKAFNLNPDTINAYNLVVTCLKLDRIEEGMNYYRFLSENKTITKNKDLVSLIQPIYESMQQLKIDSTNTSALINISETYLKLGLTDNALKYVNMAQAADKDCLECTKVVNKIVNFKK